MTLDLTCLPCLRPLSLVPHDYQAVVTLFQRPPDGIGLSLETSVTTALNVLSVRLK